MEYIELPKDADGREIPRNTEVMYDINGKKVHITSFTYHCDVFGHFAQWKVFSPDITGEKEGMLPADSLYLTKPDSLKQLAEDLNRAWNTPNVHGKDCRYMSCYYDKDRGAHCNDCRLNSHGKMACFDSMMADIVSRVNRLAGDSE